jgi:hypothetical protein
MKRALEFTRTLHRGSPVLTWTGGLHAALALVALCLMPFDERTILGVDPWLKPFKFMVSLAVYEWTLAWFLSVIENRGRSERAIAWGASLALVGETACLWLQSARGTTSHFNNATSLDAAVFNAMGILILLNTLFAAWLFVLLFLRRIDLPSPTRWGLRLGLGLFLLGSVLGLSMILRGAHAVGVPDGGPGLPLVNWSTQGGDLRIAHALGLHGLQLFPLLGWVLAQRGRSARWFLVLLPAWVAAIAGLYLGAVEGRPLWSSAAPQAPQHDSAQP